uniref:peptidase M22 n=1 Tax=Cephaloticoccus sp. TaxID=1985742 RepID=UPI004049A2EC
MPDSTRLQLYPGPSFVNIMPNLRQILASHGSILVLDAASCRIQVGVMTRDKGSRWADSKDEAGRGIFECVESLGVDTSSVEAFVFCEGPGSILGIRTTAMAVRTWGTIRTRPVYSYSSLNLVAQAINRPDVSIIADARRESWHVQKLSQALRRVALEDLTGELIMPEGFRHWSTLPNPLTITPYDVEKLLPSIAEEHILSLNESPDAFMHTEPSYKTWTPQIHRAP